jgi:hypothetical protein
MTAVTRSAAAEDIGQVSQRVLEEFDSPDASTVTLDSIQTSETALECWFAG